MASDRSDDSLSIEDYPDVIIETHDPVPDPVADGGPEPEEETSRSRSRITIRLLREAAE